MWYPIYIPYIIIPQPPKWEFMAVATHVETS